MKTLCVSATDFEVAPLINRLKELYKHDRSDIRFAGNNLEIEFLITGVGMMAATYTLTRALQTGAYDFVLNAGIAGSFDPDVPAGKVFRITEEALGDTGFINEEGFFSLADEGFPDASAFPFKDQWLVSDLRGPFKEFTDHLPVAKGLTVNCITSIPDQVQMRKYHFKADVESMEGAAIFYVCLQEDITFAEIRAVSNVVGVRDKARWNINKAVDNLAGEVLGIFQRIEEV